MRLLSVLFVTLFFSLSSIPSNAQDQILIDSLKRELNVAEDTVKLQVLNKLFWKLIFIDAEEAKRYVDFASELASKVGDSAYIASVENDYGVYYWSQSQYGQSLTKFKYALGIFERLNNQNRISSQLNNIGNIYDELGDYETALDYQIKALRIKEKLDLDGKKIANSYVNIGNIHVELANYNLAIEYYEKALAIGEQIQNLDVVMSCKMNLAVVYGNSGNHALAIETYKYALKHWRQNNAQYDVASVLDGLGQEYFSLGQLDSALVSYQESSQINEEFGYEDILGLNFRNIGEVFAEKGSYSEALDYLFKALAISERSETQKELIHDYRVIASTYKKIGDFQKALLYHEKYMDQYSKVFSSEKEEAINRLQIQFETEKKEAEIASQKEEIRILNQQAEIDDLKNKLLIATVAASFFVAVLIFYGQKQRAKRREAEQEQERAAYEKEIAFKKKELTTHTLHLVQKNELLDELRSKIEDISKNSSEDKRALNRVVQLIKNDSMADKDWANFKMYFEQVHEDFDLKLRERFNDLTSNEMRLAALMKMNLTTKEMANILNISPDSVNKARYRLRKKLKLSADDSLTDFILAL
ncbi:MAG: tetratricopeptide repeat protein [Bacteroidota bacterium]